MTAETGARPLSAEDYERILLARLGLPASASSEDIEAAHYAVTHYLAKAPRELKDWARRQAAEIDETYAILIDPTALADPAALVGPATRSVAAPGGPATPPVRRDSRSVESAAATPTVALTAAAAAIAADEPAVASEATSDDEATFEEMLAAVTPTAHRETLPDKHVATPTPNTLTQATAARPPKGKRGRTPAAAPAATAPIPAAPARGGRLRQLALVGAGALLAVVAMAAATNGFSGGGTAGIGADASPQPSAAASTAPVLDTAAVATLMQKLQADPKDTATLMALADEYYKTEDWATAKSWLDKLLAIDPKHIKALLASGAVAFNQGDLPNAKTAWEKVVAIEPNNVEAHYDLGFLYLNETPADMAGLQREWGKVVEIAPDSDVAKTVKAHLDALASPAPSGAAGSPAPSAAPSSVPSADPTATPSAAPSGSANP